MLLFEGIIGFDAETGFWLIQSTPKFPNKKADGYGWPSNGNYYAQSFLCISMATNPYLNEIGMSFVITRLTPYDTIPTLRKKAFKTLMEKEKRLVPAFSPFPLMFSTLPKTNFTFSVKSNLSSANAVNLDQSGIFSSGLFILRIYGSHLWIGFIPMSLQIVVSTV